MMITQAEVREFFKYDGRKGLIYWRKIPTWARNISVGDVAGSPHGDGYCSITFKGKKYLRHRLVWFYVYGTWPKELDHINNIRGDDRIANLRSVTRSQNKMNCRLYKSNKSGFKGVFHLGDAYKTKPWRAYIRKDGKKIDLGLFATAEEAGRARNRAAQELHGQFAR